MPCSFRFSRQPFSENKSIENKKLKNEEILLCFTNYSYFCTPIIIKQA